jgi:hypothetical protein
MLRLLKSFVGAFVLVAFCTVGAYAQSGKISGTVTDAESGDPLPGVNVVIEGTTQGTTTATDGFYNILNVAPGTYTLRASFVGYAAQVVEEVNVNVDLTTTVDFALQEEAVGLDEVVVQSRTPVVQPDVSANVANVSMSEMQSVPVTSVDEVIGMQAGVQGNLQIRGSGADEMDFIVDGMSARNARNNTPFTGISYTSVEEVQVQTGGFNAEYGNVRSGVVNVSLKEGPRDRYTADVLTRYSPASKKYFGPMPNAGINGEVPPEDMGYWLRPYLDPEVRDEGTSAWDQYTRRQYTDFRGWNTVQQELENDEDAIVLSKEQLLEEFRWYYRKDMEPTAPDYTVDGSFGGPVPVVSSALGDLRFFASFRQKQDAYLIPQQRDAYRERLGQLKLTSNITSNMKWEATGMLARQYGLSNNSHGFAHIYDSGGEMASSLENARNRDPIFAKDTYSITNIDRMQIGTKLTHTLGSNTFYTVRLQRNSTGYETGPDPDRMRDPSTIHTIGSKEYSEAPFGFDNSSFTYTNDGGLELSGPWAMGRDSSDVRYYRGQFDMTHQMTNFSQFKGGFDFNYTDFNSAHERVDPTRPSLSNPDYYWHRYTSQGAAYLQNKLEFQGMVANLGVRLDYFKPLGTWYAYDTFERAFASNEPETIDQEPIEGSWELSPRMGISFPVTTNSKLYFNYGHFRNVQQMHDLFVVREIFAGASIDRIGNPQMPMSKTVSYELGFDQNLFDTYLLRISGYYKAQSDQPRYVDFESIDGRVNYDTPLPLNYGDVRGVEFSIRKNTGRWIRGFANYTYMVEKSGNFGYGNIYENRQQMRDEVRLSREIVAKPNPQPYAKFNIEFLTPTEFGPALGAIHPFANLRLDFFGDWGSGDIDTWAGPGGSAQLSDNIQWKSYKMVDMRLAKDIEMGVGSAQLFVDVSNVFNIRNFSQNSAFLGDFDRQQYLESLHLPEDTFEEVEQEPYLWVYGDDQPGDIRDWDVEFHPIEAVRGLPSSGHPRPLYYDKQTEDYYEWDGSSFVEADEGLVNQVLDDKAYIDNPNSRYFTFLNPRQFQFGMRLTF